MRDIERLAILQAIYKAVGEAVDTKNPDSLRGQVDARYRELYYETGAKSYDVVMDGEKVGTYSMRFSKPTAEDHHIELAITDREEFDRYITDGVNLADAVEFVREHPMEFTSWMFETSGDIAPGCGVNETYIPAIDPQLMGGTLKIDQEKVIAKARQLVGADGIAGLLEGGEDGR